MSLRLAHLSDIHFGCENAVALAAAHERLLEFRPDLVAITGDITQFGWVREFEAASAWLRTLPWPWISTPGNHDTPYAGLVSRTLFPFGRYARHVGPDDADGHIRPELAVQAFNTARGLQPRLNWSKGQARVRDARRVCEAFADAGGALKVAICHHPLMEVTGGPMTGRVWGGVRASEILAQGGTDLILTGHVHMPFAHPLPFADGCTYAVGASTLSQRERGVPAGFNLIEADPARIQITALGWTGSRLEAQRSWGFDRRSAAAPPQEAGGPRSAAA